MQRAICVLAVLAFVLAGGTWASAQEDGERAMRVAEDLRDAYQKAYNAHDAEAVAGLYTEDADVVYPNGAAVRGIEQIRKELERIFSVNEKTRIAIEPKAARFITRRVLLIDGVTEIADGPPELPPRTHHTVVFQRGRGGQDGQGGRWRIAAIRMIAPAERPE